MLTAAFQAVAQGQNPRSPPVEAVDGIDPLTQLSAQQLEDEDLVFADGGPVYQNARWFVDDYQVIGLVENAKTFDIHPSPN